VTMLTDQGLKFSATTGVAGVVNWELAPPRGSPSSNFIPASRYSGIIAMTTSRSLSK
jgi:hypothetical protein